MEEPKIPLNEAARLKALKGYQVLDTPAEECFDNLTRLASQIAQTPIALVSLVDEERQWFKSKVGLGADCTGRDISFCGHAILQNMPLVVSDTLNDDRFRDNPLVTGDPKIRFYLGVPLVTPDQFSLGTLCVIDSKPRKLTPEAIGMIAALARQVVDQLELRRAAMEMQTLAKTVLEQSEAKNNFLACISHEIRTPLTSIMGMVDLMLDTSEDQEHRDNLNTIKNSGSSILRQVNDILDFSKIESGKVDFEVLDFELDKKVKRLLGSYELLAKSKGIDFVVNYDETLPSRVAGDPIRIEQVLSNLVYNALKFTSKGAVKVSFTNVGKNENGQEIRIDVEDTGVGIPAEVQTQIFSPYAQADVSTTRSHGGTGLGLPIASRLVEMMGGEIYLESELGKGSRFWFTLTLLASEKPLASPVASSRTTGKSLKILVVEDNPVNRVIVSKLIERLGHKSSLAVDGASALRIAKENHFDAILMDVYMPDMDGFEVVKELRNFEQDVQKQPTPILALTAAPHLKEQCLQAGMDGLLSKPLNMDILAQSLSELQ